MQDLWNNIGEDVMRSRSKYGNAHLWVYLLKIFSSILNNNDNIPDNAVLRLNMFGSNPNNFDINIKTMPKVMEQIKSGSDLTTLYNAESLKEGQSLSMPVLAGGHWTSFALTKKNDNEYDLTKINSLGDCGSTQRQNLTYDKLIELLDKLFPEVISDNQTIDNDEWSSQMDSDNSDTDNINLKPLRQEYNVCHMLSVMNLVKYFQETIQSNPSST